MSDEEKIQTFLRERGATKCPPVAVLPTTAEVPEIVFLPRPQLLERIRKSLKVRRRKRKLASQHRTRAKQ